MTSPPGKEGQSSLCAPSHQPLSHMHARRLQNPEINPDSNTCNISIRLQSQNSIKCLSISKWKVSEGLDCSSFFVFFLSDGHLQKLSYSGTGAPAGFKCVCACEKGLKRSFQMCMLTPPRLGLTFTSSLGLLFFPPFSLISVSLIYFLFL